MDYCKVAKDTYALQLNNHTYMLKFKTSTGTVSYNLLYLYTTIQDLYF